MTAWIAVLAGMVGAFMAILNIQITNASLLDIEGEIGTGVENDSRPPYLPTASRKTRFVVLGSHALAIWKKPA